MAEAFIGFVISVRLQSGLKLTGTVAHIEPASQQMTLKDVELQFPGQPVHYTSVYGVFGTDIVDLQVVSQAATTTAGTILPTTPLVKNDVPHQKDDQPTKITASTPKSSMAQRQRYANNDESATERPTDNNSSRPRQKKASRSNSTNSSNITPRRSTSSGRRQQQQQGIGTRQQNGKQQQQNNGWADEDVAGFIEKEFDFQANLNMFDKKKVFAEIQEQDDTAPETLLVTLNRLPRREKNNTKKTNLLPSENVLDDEPKESNGEESDTESSISSTNPTDRRVAAVGHKPVAMLRTSETHISCVAVSPLQMAHAEHECIKVTGPSEVQLIENGGRGVSALALQILGAKRIQTGNTPVIIVLTGNNKTGAYGVSAARHLTNHGCHVVVCASEQLQCLCDTIAMQESMFIRVGGDIIYDFDELDRWTPDLIIDAMVGSQMMEQEDEKEEYEALRRMICWAGKQSASVLSIDFPSAIGGGRGRSATHCISPQWTVCLGAPKTGCLSTDVTGTLYMADIGIPRTCWKRAGVKGWNVPWGASFLVELEYVA